MPEDIGLIDDESCDKHEWIWVVVSGPLDPREYDRVCTHCGTVDIED